MGADTDAAPDAERSLLHQDGQVGAGGDEGQRGGARRWRVAGAAATFVAGAMEKGSLRSSTISLVSCAAGTGVLALPHAFAQCGLVLGTLITLAAGLLNAYVCKLLVRACEGTNSKAYEDVGITLFGRGSKAVMDYLQFVTLFGISTALLIVCGDTFTAALNEDAMEKIIGPSCRRDGSGKLPKDCLAMAMVPPVVCIIFPLSLMRDFSSLRYTNVLSVAAVVLLLITLLTKSIQEPESDFMQGEYSSGAGAAEHQQIPPHRLLVNGSSSVLIAIPIITMSFACQFNVPGIFAELKHRSPERMDTVINGATAIWCLLYTGIGVFGALSVPLRMWDDFPGDVLAHGGRAGITVHPHSDVLTRAARVAMCLLSMVVTPLLVLPMRSVLHHIVQPGAPSTATVHTLETTMLLGCAYGLAVVVPRLDIMVGLTSSTSGVFLLTIAPSCFYLKMRARNQPTDAPAGAYAALPSAPPHSDASQPRTGKQLRHRCSRILPYIPVVVGMCILVLSTTFTVKDKFFSSNPAGGTQNSTAHMYTRLAWRY